MCVTATAEKVPVDQLLSAAKEAAEAGATVVMDGVDKPRQVSYKGLTDLVTNTDQASEDAVLGSLRSAFPDHALLGEEGGVSGNTSSDYLWCVDPLDGTTNFAHGYPSFGVSVGVLRHAIPVAACVVEFTGGPGLWSTRTFTASRNHGAFADGKRITVSRVKELERSLMATGFGYDHDEPWAATMDLFRHFTDVTQGVRRLGAAAVDLCHVGLGISECFFEYRLKPWDVAAGVLVVEEAGGLVTTMDGCAYSVFDRSVLATNGSVHGAIQEKTEAATADLRSKYGVDFSPWFVPEGYGVKSGAQL
ncbi:hypothetical protein BSKO_09072 [Bryopsis sp. KO-2023]|nr:hypothetical protein BSKO_09072 [Bryopsis sp. KO-2023]